MQVNESPKRSNKFEDYIRQKKEEAIKYGGALKDVVLKDFKGTKKKEDFDETISHFSGEQILDVSIEQLLSYGLISEKGFKTLVELDIQTNFDLGRIFDLKPEIFALFPEELREAFLEEKKAYDDNDIFYRSLAPKDLLDLRNEDRINEEVLRQTTEALHLKYLSRLENLKSSSLSEINFQMRNSLSPELQSAYRRAEEEKHAKEKLEEAQQFAKDLSLFSPDLKTVKEQLAALQSDSDIQLDSKAIVVGALQKVDDFISKSLNQQKAEAQRRKKLIAEANENPQNVLLALQKNHRRQDERAGTQ